MLGMGRFGDAHLERLFRRHRLQRDCSLLVYALCILTAALLIVALNHLPRPDAALLSATVAAAIALALNIGLNVKSPQSRGGVPAAIGCWLCAITALCNLAGGQSGLLPTMIGVFSLYTVFPFGWLWTLVAAVSLSAVQMAAFAFLPATFSAEVAGFETISAAAIAHFATHFVGCYLFVTRQRLCRAVFLNSRNVLGSQHDALRSQSALETLLAATAPSFAAQSALNYLCRPKSAALHSAVDSQVLFAKFDGFEGILSQISAQDACRLLNEFHSRVDQLAKKYDLIRIPSDSVILIGVSNDQSQRRQSQHGAEDRRHTVGLCHAAWELGSMIRSFCDATNADLRIKVGIASGPLSTGIIGFDKWHYEATGKALDDAIALSDNSSTGCILITDSVHDLVAEEFVAERIEFGGRPVWRLLKPLNMRTASVAFPSQRRLSLTTVPQSINRLLNSTAVADSTLFPNGRRKRKMTDSIVEKLEMDDAESHQLMNFVTMRFRDPQLEAAFHFDVDRWFIPAIALTIFLLVVYGIFHMLVMPRLLITFGLILFSLALLFLLLLMLYVSFFESFCHFVTRTAAGHSIVILFVLCLVYVSGIVNTFSCPTSYSSDAKCSVVYYPIISLAFWILNAAVFVRFNSLQLLFTLLTGIGVFCVHMFYTHSLLYVQFFSRYGERIELDVLIGLVTLALLVFAQSRRSERLIRMDFLSHIRYSESVRRSDRISEFIAMTLQSQLPKHIAANYFNRTDPYSHMCHSVGVVSACFGSSNDWSGESGLRRLQKLLRQIDQLLITHVGVEKVRHSQWHYTAAVGVLPEAPKNVHDAPFTIGDLLASLTNFAIAMRDIAEEEELDVAIGVDCGPALSVVVGGSKPYYDVIGRPRQRAAELMNVATQRQQRLIVSEEIFMALRPRHFDFDEANPIQIGPGLVGYGMREVLGHSIVNPQYDGAESEEQMDSSAEESGDEERQLLDRRRPIGEIPKPAEHPLSFFLNGGNDFCSKQSLFNSMASSVSSDLFSIDLSVESDSEIEWITPEAMAYEGQQRPKADRRPYKSDAAKQYSDFSEAENLKTSPSRNLRRKKLRRPSLSRNGPRVPGWLSSRSSMNSALSLEPTRRVDRMLQELSNLGAATKKPPAAECSRFPLGFNAISLRSVNSNDREMSSVCHTEYDNAESESALSDSEMAADSRMENGWHKGEGTRQRRSRLAALAFQLGGLGRRRRHQPGGGAEPESQCSSIASSSAAFDRLRWKSVHSIGYENEYEFASETDVSALSPSATSIDKGCVGVGEDFPAMDADSDDADEANGNPEIREQVQAISRDICNNFGDFRLSSFSDMDN